MQRAAMLLIPVMAMCAFGDGSAGSTENSPASAPAAAATPAAPAESGMVAVWTARDGLENPESVYFDPASGFIYSSQVAGAPDARDGNGRIVKLDRDGSYPGARKLLQVSSAGDVREIAEFASGATDIGVMPERNLVLVPHMSESKIVAYRIDEALK